MGKAPPKRMRSDQLLVARGLSESRARAQASIAAGLVTADGVKVTKSSQEIACDARLEATPEHPWLSRGGLKLAQALDRFGFDPAGKTCLDVGASTGGCFRAAPAASTPWTSATGNCTCRSPSGRKSSRSSAPTRAISTASACPIPSTSW